MPAKKAHPAKPRHEDAADAGLKKNLSQNLLITEGEKEATSKSLYGDHQARISSNLPRVTDRVRISAYTAAINSCVRGKTVLHLGCGIGLLSMIAARAQAAKVVGVDTSTIVNVATDVAQQNKLSNLQFLQGSVRQGTAKLPMERFDIILCEWMGAFLSNDPLFLELLYCKKHHLAEGGLLVPNRSGLHVVGVSDYTFRQDGEGFWDSVYGFKMSAMKPLVLNELNSGHVPNNTIVSNPAPVHSIDVAEYAQLETEVVAPEAASAAAKKEGDSNAPEGKVKRAFPEHASFEAPFTITAKRKCTLHFLTFYVDAAFTDKRNPSGNFVLGFQPGGHRNAFTEVSATLPEPLPVCANDTVTGSIRVVPIAPQHTEAYITVRCKNDLIDHTSTTKYMFQF